MQSISNGILSVHLRVICHLSNSYYLVNSNGTTLKCCLNLNHADMKYTGQQTMEWRAPETLDRNQLKEIRTGYTLNTSTGGSAKRCHYSYTFKLHGEFQTVHSFGATCKTSFDCSNTATGGTYEEPWYLAVDCI